MSENEQRRRSLVAGLVGEQHRHLWQTNATFRAAVLALADMLPYWVDGLAAHAENVNADMDRMRRELMTPTSQTFLPPPETHRG
jgi:hypothetical protein